MKIRGWKKVTVSGVVTAGMLAGLLTGCGSSGQTGTADTAATTQAPESAAAESTQAPAAEATEGSTEAVAVAEEEEEEEEEASGSTYTPGTYTGTGKGMEGDVTATVTVDENAITDVQLDVSGETEGIGAAAGDALTEQILEARSADIDGVSGATVTGSGIKDAVAAALRQAQGGSTETAGYTLNDGTYEGTAQGHGGPLTVTMTVQGGKIKDLAVSSQTESWTVPHVALEKIPEEIVEGQTLDVDAVSSSTVTSNAIILAAADAIEKAGGDAAAWRTRASVAEEPAKEAPSDRKTQLVVAGAGAGGLATAAFAASRGIDVVVLEKEDIPGGSMKYAAGGMAVAESEALEKEGYDTSIDRIMACVETMNEDTENTIDEEFVRYLLENSGETVDTLIDDWGYVPTVLDGGFGEDYVHVLFGEGSCGSGLSDLYADTITSNGGTILYGAEVTDVDMDGDRAAGVEVTTKDGDFTVSADYVVLATGGTSCGWDDLMERVEPSIKDVDIFNEASVGNTGDGCRILKELGADLPGDDVYKFGFPAYGEPLHYSWANVPSTQDVMIVDAIGRRFTNEAPLDSDMVSKQEAEHGSSACYAIFDAAHMDEGLKANLDANEEDPKVYVKADSIRELAEKTGMYANSLQNTFDTYQRYCETGVDEDYGKDASHLVEYDGSEGYYAVYTMPEVWGTMGGVSTDRTFHVQKEDGSAFENLYAVGELSTGALFGDYYMGGFSLSCYATGGRLVAEDIAADLK